MQLALYQANADPVGSGASRDRRANTPAERVLEGELLRDDRRRERQSQAPAGDAVSAAAEARAQGERYVPPPHPANEAIATYLRTADPQAWSPPSRLHLVV